MNSYNNNEYEIIDSHDSPYPPNRNNDHSRYPYTNNPNQPMQHANYKDWLNLSQHIQPYANCDNNSFDWLAGVSAGVIVVGTMLAAIATPIATPVLVGSLIISVGTLLPFLWPGGQSDNNSVWKKFLEQGSNLTCQELTPGIKVAVDGALNNLKAQVQYFNNAVTYWERSMGNSDEARARDQAKETFRNAVQIIEGLMPTFRSSGYEVLLLSTYAQAALLQITLLHQGIQYANVWDLARDTGDFYRDRLYEAIDTHIDYCETWYQTGLNQLESNSELTFAAYVNYRREYSINVLDIIALMPTFDLRWYPDNKKAINIEFTRNLFTIVPNLNQSNLSDFKGIQNIRKIESELNPPLNIYKNLRALDLYIYKYNDSCLGYIVNTFTPANRENRNTIGYGNKNSNTNPSSSLSLDPIQSIYYCTVRNYILGLIPKVGINYINFNIATQRLITNSIQFTTNTIDYATKENILPFPEKIQNTSLQNFQYKLSHMTMSQNQYNTTFYRDAASYLYGFIWTHAQSNPTNTISFTNEKNQKTITQISAVKAYELKGGRVEKGLGHTGGNLVLFQNNYDSLSISCKINSGRYKLRIRYASNTNTTEGLNIDITTPNYQYNSFLTIQNTGLASQNPKYKQYKYAEFNSDINILNNNSTVNIQLINSKSNPYASTTFIDKLEFIPQ